MGSEHTAVGDGTSWVDLIARNTMRGARGLNGVGSRQ